MACRYDLVVLENAMKVMALIGNPLLIALLNRTYSLEL